MTNTIVDFNSLFRSVADDYRFRPAVIEGQKVLMDPSDVVLGSDIYRTFYVPGPYGTAQTAVNAEPGRFYTWFNSVLERKHDNFAPHQIWGSWPDGDKKPIGVHYVYPATIAELGKLPVIFYTPGIGSEPGQTNDIYHYWASHGFIVAVTYSFLNWSGFTHVNAARSLYEQSINPTSPLYGHIDAHNIVLTGYSAGGGSTQSAAGWLLDEIRKQFLGIDIKGAVAIQPGPSFFFQSALIDIPTLVISGEHDRICPDKLWVRPLWKTISRKPSWICMVKGIKHGKGMDAPQYSVNAPLVLAFVKWLVQGDENAAQLFTGERYGLQHDAALMRVERNSLATTL